jgi:hypothetical protein
MQVDEKWNARLPSPIGNTIECVNAEPRQQAQARNPLSLLHAQIKSLLAGLLLPAKMYVSHVVGDADGKSIRFKNGVAKI